jgi:hypothetical protein
LPAQGEGPLTSGVRHSLGITQVKTYYNVFHFSPLIHIPAGYHEKNEQKEHGCLKYPPLVDEKFHSVRLPPKYTRKFILGFHILLNFIQGHKCTSPICETITK